MRKGKGRLTYKQLHDTNKMLNKSLDKALLELRGMTAAHNKLLRERRAEKG